MSSEKSDSIVRWEWHGNVILLVLLFLTGILIPVAAVYFMTNLIRLETRVGDAEEFSTFLAKKKL